MTAGIELFESTDRTPLDFCLWGWMKSGRYKRKVDTRDEPLVRILDAAVCVNNGEDQLRRTAPDLRTRFAKCVEVDGGIFEQLLRTVRPPLWSSGQSFCLQIQRSRVRFPVLPDFLSTSGSGTGSTQPREVN